jgi:hypothetical protein
MELAEGYAELLKRPGYDVATLAAKVGKSESYIYQHLKLLDLLPELQEAFVQDRIQFGHARILAPLSAAQQREIAKSDLFDHSGGAVSIKSLQQRVRGNFFLDLGKASFPIIDAGLVAKAGSCDACEKRTGYNPSLFPEVKAEDNCLDRECYYGKADAWAGVQLKELQQSTGVKPLSLAACQSYNARQKQAGVLYEEQWRAVGNGKPCEHVQKGVIVDIGRWGNDRFQIGQVVNACTSAKCTKHWGGSRPSSGAATKRERTADELKSELRIKEKADKAAALNTALITAAVEAAPFPFTLDLFRELARVMWGRLWHDHRVRVLARRGMKQQSSRDAERVDVMAEAIRTMDEVELAGIVAEIAIMESGSRREGDGMDMQELLLAPKGEEFLRALEAEAIAPVEASYEEKYARIDRAEAKRVEAAKQAEKVAPAAATKDQTAAKATVPAKKTAAKVPEHASAAAKKPAAAKAATKNVPATKAAPAKKSATTPAKKAAKKGKGKK